MSALPPPEPAPIEAFLDVSGFDVVARIVWTDGSISRLTSSNIGVYLPADDIETVNGAYYTCFPGLGPIPALKQTINGVSDEVSFTLPGVPSDLADMFDMEADLAEGAEVFIGRITYDHKLQMIGGAAWIWNGEAGEFGARDNGGSMEDGELSSGSQTLSLKVGTQQTTRSAAQLYSWSDAQHRAGHPTDAFFSEIGGLEQGTVKVFPKF